MASLFGRGFDSLQLHEVITRFLLKVKVGYFFYRDIVSVTRSCYDRYTYVSHASHVRVTLVTRTCNAKYYKTNITKTSQLIHNKRTTN